MRVQPLTTARKRGPVDRLRVPDNSANVVSAFQSLFGIDEEIYVVNHHYRFIIFYTISPFEEKYRMKARTIVPICVGLMTIFSMPEHALAWGCEGHQTVALIAWQLLHDDSVRQTEIEDLLRKNPPPDQVDHFCKGDTTLALLAQVATWADDVRNTRHDTAGWHFLDLPATMTTGDWHQFCPAAGCAPMAITNALAVLKEATSLPEPRAEAVRFLTHFVGDIHQPMHAVTNKDRGGNCVPVIFQKTPPVEQNNKDYSPNLHGAWDNNLVKATMAAEGTPKDVAAFAARLTAAASAVTVNSTADPADWAWESHKIGRDLGYGQLTSTTSNGLALLPAIGSMSEPKNCAAVETLEITIANNIKVAINDKYAAAATVRVRTQLITAGVRLAALLRTASFPPLSQPRSKK